MEVVIDKKEIQELNYKESIKATIKKLCNITCDTETLELVIHSP